MDDGVAIQVETRAAPFVEQGNVAGVANAKQRFLQRDRVADAKLAYLFFGYRHGEVVVRHRRLLVRSRIRCGHHAGWRGRAAPNDIAC